MGAYSSTPNMMGDLFGTPGQGSFFGRRFVCSATNESDFLFNCDKALDSYQHVDGKKFSDVAIDTNGDGLPDFVPNLVSTFRTFSQPGGPQPFVDNGPFFGVATDIQDFGNGNSQINTADIFEQIIIEGTGGGSTGPGLLLGRVKIAENNSPLPRDRVFVNYSHFNNVPIFPGGVNVNRITPGFEKTFHNGQMSIELRAPFGTTLDNDVTADGFTSTNETLVGNMMLVYKALLLTGPRGAISGGLSVSIPTANDLTVRLTDGSELLRLHNDSVHVSPYVAYVGAPTDRLFFQMFLQAEFDLNGNQVDAQGSGGTLQQMGRVNDTNYLYCDVGTGYYVYRNRFDRLISSFAPVAELHWNKTLQASDTIRAGGVQIGNFAQNVDVLNGVVGLNMTLGTDTTVTVGYTTPLGAGDNKQFDGEFRLLVNHYFGS